MHSSLPVPPSTSVPSTLRSPPSTRRARSAVQSADSVSLYVESPVPVPVADSPSAVSPLSAVSVAPAPTSVNIAELKRKSVPELQEMAEGYAIENPGGLRKQDLIFRIEQKLLDQNIVLSGEGVLEILPEGYGFLRSQDWNYLYGPDDIYVSPSQIKRFDLRTGDTVS